MTALHVGDQLDNGATVKDLQVETLDDGTVIEHMTDSDGNYTGTTTYPDGHPARVREALLDEATGHVIGGIPLLSDDASPEVVIAQVNRLSRLLHGLTRLQLGQIVTEEAPAPDA